MKNERQKPAVNEKILVVDDDEKICQILSLYLRSKGYEVVTCQSGSKAIAAFEECGPDLVLLDVMLPGLDGWEILSRIRKISNAPVIMLTAKGDTTDRVQGLDCGADDYVVKPFDSKELIARIRAVLRRAGQPEEIEKHIKIGNLDVDTSNRVVYVDENRIELSPKEFDLLCYFIHNDDKVLTRGQLLDDVWGFEFYGDSRTVDVHVKRLRDKLGQSESWSIRTVWRVGYKFERFDLPKEDSQE